MIKLTICYVLENTLYINLTNRCTNRCTFCVRDKDCGIGDVNLWLDREPTEDEIIEDIKKFNPDSYDEVVFCGYGEPTMRLEVLLSCAEFIKRTIMQEYELTPTDRQIFITKRILRRNFLD